MTERLKHIKEQCLAEGNLGPFVATASGERYYFLFPDYSCICIQDIAAHLSKLTRFTGATQGDEAYSVAQHSLHVASLVPAEYALQALLHDAAEAYLGDVSAPLKGLLPDYKELEDACLQEVFKTFGVVPTAESNKAVHAADVHAFDCERKLHMPHFDWCNPPGLMTLEDYSHCAIPMLPHGAEELFLQRFAELTEKAVV